MTSTGDVGRVDGLQSVPAPQRLAVPGTLPTVVRFGPFDLHPYDRRLMRGREVIRIGSRALDLLITLLENQGKVVGKQAMIQRAWPDLFVDDCNLRVHISALRKVLDDGRHGARYIVNVPGRGYLFVRQAAAATQTTMGQGTDFPLPVGKATSNGSDGRFSDTTQHEILLALKSCSDLDASMYQVVELAHERIVIIRVRRQPKGLVEAI